MNNDVRHLILNFVNPLLVEIACDQTGAPIPYDQKQHTILVCLTSCDTCLVVHAARHATFVASLEPFVVRRHPLTCNGGNPDLGSHHDHEVRMQRDGNSLVCPECGRVQDLPAPPTRSQVMALVHQYASARILTNVTMPTRRTREVPTIVERHERDKRELARLEAEISAALAAAGLT